MADVFSCHLEWTGSAKGPTRDPATFSRDLNLAVESITLPMSTANPAGSRADETRARELVAKVHDGCFVANSVSTPVDIEPTFAFTGSPAAA